jgi:DNA-directed RNA polymerase III subunit RPC3
VVDGEAPPAAKKPNLPVKSVAHLNSIICRLAEAELVDVVHGLTFVSPEDIQKDVEERVTRVKFPGGVKGGKGKIEFEEAVAMELCKIRRESKSLKRKLEESGATAVKRRKLLNGAGVNGVNGNNGDHDADDDPVLDVCIRSTMKQGNLANCLLASTSHPSQLRKVPRGVT